jgi:hypothetical protein
MFSPPPRQYNINQTPVQFRRDTTPENLVEPTPPVAPNVKTGGSTVRMVRKGISKGYDAPSPASKRSIRYAPVNELPHFTPLNSSFTSLSFKSPGFKSPQSRSGPPGLLMNVFQSAHLPNTQNVSTNTTTSDNMAYNKKRRMDRF